MAAKPDIVVVGGGHNTLAAAAYLARAGLGVLVLEQRDEVGGGVTSTQSIMPGFIHDNHATVAAMLQGSPIVTHDELGLLSKYGIKFAYGEIGDMTVFDDGDTLACHVDLEKTCAEIAKFSKKDADAYRRMVAFMQPIMPLMGMGMIRPPVSFGAFVSLVEKMPFGNELLTNMMKSGYDLLTEMFEHPKVILHFMKWAGDLLIAPEVKGSGTILMFVIAATHAGKTGGIVGGSQKLSDAMAQCIKDHGGTIRTGARVKRIVNERGNARAVELADGEIITAGKAVVAAIHPHLLGDMVSGLDANLISRAKRTHTSSYGVFSIHAALDRPLQWKCGNLPNEAVHFHLVNYTDIDTIRKSFDDLRYGELPRHFTGGAVIPSNLDPSRAPPGKQAAYFYVCMPYALKNGGPDGWDAIKEKVADDTLAHIAKFATNFTDDIVLARRVDSPRDMERFTPSMQRGDTTGIGTLIYQSMGLRPIADLAQYRVPGAEGLYLSGPFMHPGGGLNGGGRAVAIRVMEDLKINSSKVLKI